MSGGWRPGPVRSGVAFGLRRHYLAGVWFDGRVRAIGFPFGQLLLAGRERCGRLPGLHPAEMFKDHGHAHKKAFHQKRAFAL